MQEEAKKIKRQKDSLARKKRLAEDPAYREEFLRKKREYEKRRRADPKWQNHLREIQSNSYYKHKQACIERAKTYRRKRKLDPEIKARLRAKDYAYEKRVRDKTRPRKRKLQSSDKYLTYRRQYYRKKYNEDINFRIESALRSRFVIALKKYEKGSKVHSIKKLIGCSIDDLVKHIESKFIPGMLWENRTQWHIDHIVPVSSFDLTKIEEQERCFHYTNLQPLWAIDNIRKGNKIIES